MAAEAGTKNAADESLGSCYSAFFLIDCELYCYIVSASRLPTVAIYTTTVTTTIVVNPT